MFLSVFSRVGLLTLLAACGYAAWAGDRPVRWVALLSLTAWIASAAVQAHDLRQHTQWAVFAVDVAFLAALLALAIHYDRWWLLFTAAYQLLTVATHIANIADAGLHRRSYAVAYYAWSYLTLIALAWGAWATRRRRLHGTWTGTAAP